VHELLNQFLVLFAVDLTEFRHHFWSAFVAALEGHCRRRAGVNKGSNKTTETKLKIPLDIFVEFYFYLYRLFILY